MLEIIGGGGDPGEAQARLQEALRIGLEVGDPWTYLNARAWLTGIIDLRGHPDLEQVKATLSEMLAEARGVGNTWAENRALVSTAMVAHMQGDFDRAQAQLDAAADLTPATRHWSKDSPGARMVIAASSMDRSSQSSALAIRQALRERRQRLLLSRGGRGRGDRMVDVLEAHLWPKLPADVPGRSRW